MPVTYSVSAALVTMKDVTRLDQIRWQGARPYSSEFISYARAQEIVDSLNDSRTFVVPDGAQVLPRFAEAVRVWLQGYFDDKGLAVTARPIANTSQPDDGVSTTTGGNCAHPAIGAVGQETILVTRENLGDDYRAFAVQAAAS